MATRDDNYDRLSVRLEVDLFSLDESRTVNYQDLLRTAIEKTRLPKENGCALIEMDTDESDSSESENLLEKEKATKIVTSTTGNVNPSHKSVQELPDSMAPKSSPVQVPQNKDAPNFPSGLPNEIEPLANDLIQTYSVCRVSPRKFFRHYYNSSKLLKLAKALNGISSSKKTLVVQYMTHYLPFKKSTLIVRMNKVLKEHRSSGDVVIQERRTEKVETNSLLHAKPDDVSYSGSHDDEKSKPKPALKEMSKSSGGSSDVIEITNMSKTSPLTKKPDYKAIDFQSMEMNRKDAVKPVKNSASGVECPTPVPLAFCARSTPEGRERNELLFMIKNVLSHYLPTRHTFFNCSLAPLICALDRYIQHEFKKDRSQIYDHISFFAPCSRRCLELAVTGLLERQYNLKKQHCKNIWCEFEPSKARRADGLESSIEAPAIHGNEERFKFSQEKHKSREDLRRKVDFVMSNPNFLKDVSIEFREHVVKSNTLFSFQHFEERIGQKAYEFAQKCLVAKGQETPREYCALPDRMSSKMNKLICDIKLAASSIKHFNREFYESPILPALHELDVFSRRCLKPSERRQMHEHLSNLFPCDSKNFLKLVDALYEPHICYIMHYRRQKRDSKVPRKDMKKAGESSQERLKTDAQKNASKKQKNHYSRPIESKAPPTSKPEVEIFKVPQPVCDSEASKDDLNAVSSRTVSMLEDEQRNIDETNTAINVLSQMYTEQEVAFVHWNETERPPQVPNTSSNDEYHLQQLLQDLKDLKQLSTDKS